MNRLYPDVYVRYAVLEEVSHDPMYGKTRMIYSEDYCRDDVNRAVSLAKEYSAKHPDAMVFVWAYQYTSRRNAERHFAMVTDYVWGSWLEDWQAAPVIKEFEKYDSSRKANKMRYCDVFS